MRTAIIRLRHEDAPAFFAMMSSPDSNVMQARDGFLRSLKNSTHIRRDGSSLVMDIPDNEVGSSLFSKNISNLYNSIPNPVNARITFHAYIPSGSYSCSIEKTAECYVAHSGLSQYASFYGNCPEAA